jgi:hypothetical protein
VNIYENIVIGNFLFEFGVHMGRGKPDLPLLSVNLLQQCPGDEPLADVLLANSSFCLLMEFKRKRNRSDKEVKKLQTLQNGIHKSEDSQVWEDISRKLHWYVEINDGTKTKPMFEVRATPYLDFQQSSEYVSFDGFAERAAKEACEDDYEVGLAERNLKYLKFVSKINSAIGIEDAEKETGAFMVSLTRDGRLQSLAVPRMEMMFSNQWELELALSIERGPDTQSQERGRGYDYGHGYSR